jgi:dTDP-4-dehydrorhamnose reductase
MNNLVVLGSEGMLGRSIVPILKEYGYELITVSKNSSCDFNADLTDRNQLINLLNKLQPKTILNLTALTNIEYCEVDINSAYKINVGIVENIAYWLCCNQNKSHLVQISTDHIYDGNGHSNESSVVIRNVYGLTKYAGELAAAKSSSSIIRLNFLGRSKLNEKKSLTDWIYSSSLNRSSIEVFDNIYFCPLSYQSLVKILHLIIQTRILGVYNVGCKNGLSKAKFAYKFLDKLGMPTRNMIETNYDIYRHGINVKRPFDMRMCVQKIENALGIKMPTIDAVIDDVAKEYI